jgi:hypothetical protein
MLLILGERGRERERAGGRERESDDADIKIEGNCCCKEIGEGDGIIGFEKRDFSLLKVVKIVICAFIVVTVIVIDTQQCCCC